MAGNSFGQIFRITTYGESHGIGIGVIIDGCPAGLEILEHDIQMELNRRKPGQSDIVSPRKEMDKCQILSGVHNGFSMGSPIHIFVPNDDARPEEYSDIANVFRPSHADFTYFSKYGVQGVSGGGRSSARETIARVAGGAVAKALLKRHNIKMAAYVSQVGKIKIPPDTKIDTSLIENNSVRCPDQKTAEEMIQYINHLKENGDSTGGVISCVIENCPIGLGEPVFDKLHADLGKAMLSINAVKAFELGSGFAGVEMKGSEHNDVFITEGQEVLTKTNYSGGIQGGITNGMPILFRVGFKPVSTISKPQDTIDHDGKNAIVQAKGRHDPCVVPRAVPIVEAMAALVLADHLLRAKISKL
ncbi:MAG: chorismate synthase [Saprospiraceae bacterium]|nr:chorismate synthase [Saprospiraceae bacterium]MBK6566677.1 chorismate synthase [Saprospiraceae bacterium]MBK7522987.1 chorismate synthase [Saprospiraceae bacterium]MBK8081834.1 chorismate synthase [Saprospiraceae bacterium]MBK8370638.1 chorismate synthase [Saprospiraceae bacterium]